MIRLRGKAKSRQRRPDPSKGTGHVSRSLEAISTMGGFLRGPVVACQQPDLLLGGRREASHRRDGRGPCIPRSAGTVQTVAQVHELEMRWPQGMNVRPQLRNVSGGLKR